jgi:hypothetical protein
MYTGHCGRWQSGVCSPEGRLLYLLYSLRTGVLVAMHLHQRDRGFEDIIYQRQVRGGTGLEIHPYVSSRHTIGFPTG